MSKSNPSDIKVAVQIRRIRGGCAEPAGIRDDRGHYRHHAVFT